jgi:hypothetical protein
MNPNALARQSRRFKFFALISITALFLPLAQNALAQTNLCKAILARKSVKLSGNMLVDSFNSMDPAHSTNGRYDSTKRQDGADIASVSDTVTVITDTGNTSVYGHLVTSPSGSVSISGNASVGSMAAIEAFSPTGISQISRRQFLTYPFRLSPFPRLDRRRAPLMAPTTIMCSPLAIIKAVRASA